MNLRNGILPTTSTFMVKLRSFSHCPRSQYVASVVSFPPIHLIHQPGHYCWLQHQHCSTDWSHTYFNIFISHNPCVDLDTKIPTLDMENVGREADHLSNGNFHPTHLPPLPLPSLPLSHLITVKKWDEIFYVCHNNSTIWLNCLMVIVKLCRCWWIFKFCVTTEVCKDEWSKGDRHQHV